MKTEHPIFKVVWVEGLTSSYRDGGATNALHGNATIDELLCEELLMYTGIDSATGEPFYEKDMVSNSDYTGWVYRTATGDWCVDVGGDLPVMLRANGFVLGDYVPDIPLRRKGEERHVSHTGHPERKTGRTPSNSWNGWFNEELACVGQRTGPATRRKI